MTRYRVIRNTLAACLAVTGVVGLAACGERVSSSDTQYRGVCVDPNTKTYVDPSNCGSDGSDRGSAVWDYILLSTFMNTLHSNPSYYDSGHTVTHVVYHLPANSTSTVQYSAGRGRSPYVRRVQVGSSGKVTRVAPVATPKPARLPAKGTASKSAKVPAYGTPPKVKVPPAKSGKCC